MGKSRSAGGGQARSATYPKECLNLLPRPESHLQVAYRQEARMNHWNDTMVDRPDSNGPAYLAGWTISGLAVIGTILAVWVLGL
jgi:hypothetical protein